MGVLYLHAPQLSDVDALASERGYKNRDEVKVSPQTMGDAYEDKVRSFFHEHLHEDEEIRYIRGGRGYFDVRNEGDEWVRIELEKDDLIILPPGIYHRFTTDETNVSWKPSPAFSFCVNPGMASEMGIGGATADWLTCYTVRPRHAALQGGTQVDTAEQEQ